MSTTHPPETHLGTVTSWLPLTTIFPYHSQCANFFIPKKDDQHNSELSGNSDELTVPVDAKLVAFDPTFPWEMPTQEGAECSPAEVYASWNQLKDLGTNGLTVTSLLPLTCPEAWSTVATLVRAIISTQMMCCPPGYGFINLLDSFTGLAGGCVSLVEMGATLTYASGTWSSPGMGTWSTQSVYTVMAESIDATTLEAPSLVQAVPIIGWNVQSGTSSPTTSLLNLTSSSTKSRPTSTATSLVSVRNSTDNNNSRNNKLSRGAIAGISVAAGVVPLIILALIAWIVILKRKKSTNDRKTSDKLKIRQVEEPHEMDPDSGESNSDRARELDDSQIPNELNTTNRFEMNHTDRFEIDHTDRFEMSHADRFEMSHTNRGEMNAAASPVELKGT